MDDNQKPANKEELNIPPEKPKKEIKPPPAKQYYTIKIEATAPCLLEYKILAETPEEAIEMLEKNLRQAPGKNLITAPRPNLHKAKMHKANVFLSGTSLIKLTKKL